MDRNVRRLGTLIIWEIIILALLVAIFTYMPRFVELGSYGEILKQLLPPVLLIVFVITVTKLFLYVLQPIFNRALPKYLSSSYNVNQTWQFIRYVVWIGAFTILAFALLGNTVTVSVFVGILALVLVITSYQSMANFAGWLHIIFRNPVKRGDLVEVDGIRGKITEVTTMNVVLEEMAGSLEDISRTGRRVIVPNSFVFTRPFFSLSSERALVWDEIKVLLPAQTNHLLARDVMAQVGRSVAGPIMKKHAQEMLREVSPKSDVPSVPTTMVSLEPEGVMVVLRYFCPVSERGEVRSAISESVLREFEREGIELVFSASGK
jgi:small-conductance mechanosensitive channel